MNESEKVIKLMDEALDLSKMAPYASIADVKVSDRVIVVASHPQLGGMEGIVIGIHPERGVVDLMVGKSNRMDVALADVLRWDDQASLAPVAAKPEVQPEPAAA